MNMTGKETIEQIKELLHDRLGGGYFKHLESSDTEHNFYWSCSYHTEANIKVETSFPYAAKFQYINADKGTSPWFINDYLGLTETEAKAKLQEERKPAGNITLEMINDILEYQLEKQKELGLYS